MTLISMTANNFLLHGTPAYDAASSYQVLVAKCSAVQKVSSRQMFIHTFFNLHCDFDLECSNFFFFRTLCLMMLYYQTKSYCKLTCSLEDIVETVIF